MKKVFVWMRGISACMYPRRRAMEEEVAFSDISSLNILKKKKKGSAREKLRLAEANHEIGCNYFCANVSKIHLS